MSSSSSSADAPAGVTPEQYAPPVVPTAEEWAALSHNNTGPRMNAVIWILVAISACFLGLRVYCKFSRNKGLWWDDIFLVGAWIAITIESAVLSTATTIGYGLHIWDFDLSNMPKLVMYLNVAGTFSLTAAAWSKTSFAITLLRLTHGWHKWVVWFIIVSVNVTMGLSALFPWVTCTPLRKSWDSTMKRNEKIGVAVAMSMGLFAGVTGIIKTSMVPNMLSSDFADGLILFMWGNAESNVTIVAASIPILRVLIRDAASSRRYYKSGQGSDPTRDNSKFTGAKQSHAVVTISGGPLDSQVDMQKQMADDSSDRSILGGDHPGALKTGPNGKIVQTQDFSVRYHTRDAKKDRESDEYEMHDAARYARTGVRPPPKMDNRRRFKAFIDRINRRQWELLGDGVHGQLTYNTHEMSLYELIQYLKHEFAPKTNVTLDIVTVLGGTDTDTDPSDPSDPNSPVAARLRVKTILVQGPYLASSPRKKFEYARHMVAHFTKNKISSITDISAPMHAHPSTAPITPPPSLRPPPPRVSIDMRTFYASYIATINSSRGAPDALAPFCKPAGVVHNGLQLSVERYCRLMGEAFAAIDGLAFEAKTVLVDESAQQMAALIEFSGVPVKPFGGAVPPGGERPVRFAEIVFYWLEQGRISDVLSLVDLESYREQLG
ncbi:hypothetical protein B0T22DRAFT_369447 [Podospora appendiculata]|uniref:Rhodopsin domain-containing protein n=1 Tax=Podospora appendiculata TaxID=314037 RepID=A0AAE0XH13_9PEZI|nr:hypothetical protein B0T22DRAFT_369447 [Podospora appendiculata]